MTEVTIFNGRLPMGDGLQSTMVFAQDFRLPQCILTERALLIQAEGVQVLGEAAAREVSGHTVWVDHVLIGRIYADRTELNMLPPLDAGVHRVTIQVSPYPGFSLCDDFILERVVLRAA